MKKQFLSYHIDFLGFSTSLLCAIHCAALPFLMSLAPLAGLKFLQNPVFEYIVIFLSLIIALKSLLTGYFRHHHKKAALYVVVVGFCLIFFGNVLEGEWEEIVLTSSGALLIAIAHVVNWKHVNQANS